MSSIVGEHQHDDAVGRGGGGESSTSYSEFTRHYNISVVVSLLIAIISFGLWRYSIFLPRFVQNIISSFTPTPTTTTTTTNNNNHNNNITQQRSSSSTTTTSTTNTNTSTTTDSNQPSIPYDEVFPSDIDTTVLTRINIIQNDQTFSRRFRKPAIKTVLDLKKYYYPQEISDGKRVLFICNGRSLIDTLELSTNYPNLVDDSQVIPSIHSIVRNQLTADQVSNDPNNSGRSGGGGTGTSSRSSASTTARNVTNQVFETNIVPRLSSTKSLFTITGLFLAFLWCLWFYRPIYFKPLTIFIMFIFTVAWAFTFSSSNRNESINNQNSNNYYTTSGTRNTNNNNINNTNNSNNPSQQQQQQQQQQRPPQN
ncbi:hypothetical protein DFA_09541 [Cavenderia fasciculata]|uniref:Ubiquitin-like domain-containing protein n=1 Tax=Cavenderia fasciculata TaxID=261658 RepID=F4Q7X2_CACFS|nr:uncharacterized protein DFA_09541 [Cavenderia fasciculata]EGG15872.1 hypothetical protein DFA_09541 [Cavenderia fasciculata]|eukprot:XP_004352197.1 hypothetical protein DFA_09541 [Cavenderia fasciculata]